MKPDSDGEQRVLCLRRELLEGAGRFQGVSLEVERYIPLIEDWGKHDFLPRFQAEVDLRYKQIVPYVLIVCGDAVLRYQRGDNNGERRLHGCYSIGVGGHIEERDYLHGSGYETGLRREIEEETGMELNRTPPAVAVINDDSNEVGKVHFGVVHLLEINHPFDLDLCRELSSPEFIEVKDARQNLDRYETWSQWCLQKILK